MAAAILVSASAGSWHRDFDAIRTKINRLVSMLWLARKKKKTNGKSRKHRKDIR
jgi:hypothetical protein